MMLYLSDGKQITAQHWRSEAIIPENTVWIDMNNPSRQQELDVEQFLELEIPTREEMHAIEISERLYREGDASFLTATLLVKRETEQETHAVTFIVTERHLVTLRYSDPIPFKVFAEQIFKIPAADHNGPALFLWLIDAITNRLADILEDAGRELDMLTADIFRPAIIEHVSKCNHQQMLLRIGHAGDVLSKARESLMTLSRLVGFAQQCGTITVSENRERLRAQASDIAGLSDQTNYLSGKVTFLLDAVLGLISIEQNAIIKIFSVAAAMFLPPTLIASIYGMNFEFMPELHWHYGYPLALGAMLLSALLPYFWFKRKKWI